LGGLRLDPGNIIVGQKGVKDLGGAKGNQGRATPPKRGTKFPIKQAEKKKGKKGGGKKLYLEKLDEKISGLGTSLEHERGKRCQKKKRPKKKRVRAQGKKGKKEEAKAYRFKKGRPS